jgi:Flp pilus assembly protein TadD
MSLLIDVLRKAEEGRRPPHAAASRPSTFTRDIELEPLASQARGSDGDALPDAVPAPAPRTVEPSAAPATSRRPGAMRTSWLLLGGASLGAAFAVAGWLWLETHAAAQAYVPPPATIEPSPTRLPVSSNVQPAAPPEYVMPAPPHVARPTPQRLGTATHRPPIDAAGNAPDEEPLHFRPGQPAATATSNLALSAHDAYTVGNLSYAQTQYQQVLQSEPDNLDALNGMGAIALQQSQPGQAETFFRQALLLNPHDPVALAGLTQANPAEWRRAETRLHISLAAQPDALATRIALGDNLAAQQRWAEAQQAYFQAHALAPTDPDIAYNLAVSLDHLGQLRPAATYYRRALELAAHHSARFARPQGEVRLHTLLAQENRP